MKQCSGHDSMYSRYSARADDLLLNSSWYLVATAGVPGVPKAVITSLTGGVISTSVRGSWHCTTCNTVRIIYHANAV